MARKNTEQHGGANNGSMHLTKLAIPTACREERLILIQEVSEI